MIKTITVTNYLGESLILELTRPEKSGFIVKSIDGLDPPKANVNMSDMSSDGAKFNSARLDKRNIVLHLAFIRTATETIEEIRHKAYKYFPPKTKIKMVIVSDILSVETEGIVETTPVTIFSNEETADISILCPNSYLYSTSIVTTMFSGVEPRFEFPFNNESVTEPMLEFGITKLDKSKNVHYDGDYNIGIIMTMHAVGEVTNITLYNLDTKEEMGINTDTLELVTGKGIVADDIITIDTRFGKKTATLLREGQTYNILNCISRGSKWFTLSKGGNTFSYMAASGVENLELRISNQVAYLGV